MGHPGRAENRRRDQDLTGPRWGLGLRLVEEGRPVQGLTLPEPLDRLLTSVRPVVDGGSSSSRRDTHDVRHGPRRTRPSTDIVSRAGVAQPVDVIRSRPLCEMVVQGPQVGVDVPGPQVLRGTNDVMDTQGG